MGEMTTVVREQGDQMIFEKIIQFFKKQPPKVSKLKKAKTSLLKAQMSLFHPVNSLVVSRKKYVANLIKEILIVFLLIWSNMHPKNSKILKIPKLLLLSFQQFCNFSLIESCKTYLGTMLPPGGRNWYLIHPIGSPKYLHQTSFEIQIPKARHERERD